VGFPCDVVQIWIFSQWLRIGCTKAEVSTVVQFKDLGLLGCDHVSGLVVICLLDIPFCLHAKAYGYVGSHHENYWLSSQSPDLQLDVVVIVVTHVVITCSSSHLVHQLTNWPTDWLTPWSRVLHEKLTGSLLVKKIPAFDGTQRFTTALKRARHPPLVWVRLIQSKLASHFL
jgi:hypothetical protein